MADDGLLEPDDRERQEHALYAVRHSDPRYRTLERYAHGVWGRLNREL